MSNEDIRWFDVAMHDALRVRGVQSIGDLNCQLQQFAGLERLSGDVVLQRLPFEQLHHNKGLPFVFINVVNRADVWMVEC